MFSEEKKRKKNKCLEYGKVIKDKKERKWENSENGR